MSSLSELIERVEKAQGPSRELDAEITVVLRIAPVGLPAWARDNFPTWRARPDGRVEVVHDDGTGGLHWKPADVTSSIDAALTLLPEGFAAAVGIMSFKNCDKKPWATYWTPQGVPHSVEAATPALAVVIAALKARLHAASSEVRG